MNSRGEAEIQIHLITTLVIQCSFCDKELREDRKTSSTAVDTQEYHFREFAKAKGWRSVLTTEQIELNLCPDHVSVGKEMGLID